MKIYTHLPLLYSKFIQYLLDNREITGDPIAINVFGGAKCIATNGIHYIALANKLFSHRPEKVMAHLNSDPINPRNGKLKFYDGNATWFYPNNKQLNINFSNISHVSLSLEIMYRFSKAVVEDDKFILTKINTSDIETIKKPTTTKFPSDFVIQSSAFENEFHLNETSKIYDLFNKKYLYKESKYGFSATEDLIAALISSEKQTLLNLPLKKIIYYKSYSKKWGIS